MKLQSGRGYPRALAEGGVQAVMWKEVGQLVQVTVEVEWDEQGRMVGNAWAREGQAGVLAFSGTIELVGVLERCLAAAGAKDPRPVRSHDQFGTLANRRPNEERTAG